MYTPTFSPNVYNYRDLLRNPRPQYYFKATSAASDIIIEYTFDRGDCGHDVTVWTPVVNGEPSPVLQICQNGDNIVMIRVSSATGNCIPVIYYWTSVRGN